MAMDANQDTVSGADGIRPDYALGQLARYVLGLGTWGFGGPVALVGYMQRDLVEQRGWFTRDEYMKSLALAQLAPGPLAAQLAICLGYVHSRTRGATVVSLAFILPSFVMTVAIGWLYVRFGGLSWMQAALAARITSRSVASGRVKRIASVMVMPVKNAPPFWETWAKRPRN